MAGSYPIYLRGLETIISGCDLIFANILSRDK
jgi:hypothetical protein